MAQHKKVRLRSGRYTTVRRRTLQEVVNRIIRKLKIDSHCRVCAPMQVIDMSVPFPCRLSVLNHYQNWRGTVEIQ